MTPLLLTPDERNQLAHLLRRQRDAAVGMAGVCDVAAQIYGIAMELTRRGNLPLDQTDLSVWKDRLALLGDRLAALEPGYVERTHETYPPTENAVCWNCKMRHHATKDQKSWVCPNCDSKCCAPHDLIP